MLHPISFIDASLIRKYDALPSPSLNTRLRLISLPCSVPSLHDKPLFQDPAATQRTRHYLRESYHASK